MSTRCYIGKENADKTITYIYCHNDGYVEGGVGETLLTHYTHPSDIDSLLALGDISSLGDTPVDNPRLWDTKYALSDEGRNDKCCRTYKGRGEVYEATTVANLTQYIKTCDESYVYLFRNNKWYLIDGNSLIEVIIK